MSPCDIPLIRKDFVQVDEESVGSSSEESDTDYVDSECSSDGELADLRDFIDFDPKYNRTNVTRKRPTESTGDELRDFLFHERARPRKWFTAFTQSAVGAKLTPRPSRG